MRGLTIAAAIAAILGISASAYAELQNVEVGGSLRIRYSYYTLGGPDDDDRRFFDPTLRERFQFLRDGSLPAINARTSSFFNRGILFPNNRSLTTFLGGTAGGAFTDELAFAEQRTRLSVKADFTDEVTAFIELDSYSEWGTDFRSNYITGADGPGGADVNIYQAYVEANEMWGTPLRLRIGRQEMSLGSEWLVGVNNASSFFWGLSFDAVRADYITDEFTVTAWASKLAETFDEFTQGDVDFYGVYGSYLGLEDIVIDAYWMYVRDQESLTAFDVNIHTIGLRGAGTFNAFDFEAEVAYQFGEAEDEGIISLLDTTFDYGAFAANLEAGYTFDMTVAPRIFIGYAYFGGPEDEDDLFPLFDSDEDDLGFNRLFSNWEYTEFFANTDESNLHIIRGGVNASPTESIDVSLVAAYFMSAEDRSVNRILPWRDFEAESDIGLEVGLYADYAYTEDLIFRAGFAHFFPFDGIEDGNAIVFNGLGRYIDDEEDGYNYFFVETEISF